MDFSLNEDTLEFALPLTEEHEASTLVSKASGLYVALALLGFEDWAQENITAELFEKLAPETVKKIGDAFGHYIRNMEEKTSDLPVATTMEKLLLSLALPPVRKPGATLACMPTPDSIESVGGALVSYDEADGSTVYEFHNGSKAKTTRESLTFEVTGTVPVRVHVYKCDGQGNFTDSLGKPFALSAVLALLLARDLKTLPVPGAEPVLHYLSAAKAFLNSQVPTGTRTLPALDTHLRSSPLVPFPKEVIALRTRAIAFLMQLRNTVRQKKVVPDTVEAANRLAKLVREGFPDAGKTPVGKMADTTVAKQLDVIKYLEEHHGLDATKKVFFCGSGNAHISSVDIFDAQGRKYKIIERELKKRPNSVAADAFANVEEYAGAYVVSDMLFSTEEAKAFWAVASRFPKVFVWKTMVSAKSPLAAPVSALSAYYTKITSLSGGRGHNSENFICLSTAFDEEVHKALATCTPTERDLILSAHGDFNAVITEAEVLSLFAAIHQRYTDNSILRTIAILDTYTQDQLGARWGAYSAARGGVCAPIQCVSIGRVGKALVVKTFDLEHVSGYTITSGAAFAVPLELDQQVFDIDDATTNTMTQDDFTEFLTVTPLVAPSAPARIPSAFAPAPAGAGRGQPVSRFVATPGPDGKGRGAKKPEPYGLKSVQGLAAVSLTALPSNPGPAPPAGEIFSLDLGDGN